MEAFFVLDSFSERRRERIFASIYRATDPHAPVSAEIEVYEQGIIHAPTGFTFYTYDPAGTVREILAARPELDLALARTFAPFRAPVVADTISKVSTANGGSAS